MGANHLGQPVGDSLPGWSARPRPQPVPLEGRSCRLVPLDPDAHGADLYEAAAADPDGRTWTYMAYGPFAGFEAHLKWLRSVAGRDDPLFHAVLDGEGKAVGLAALMRIDPAMGVAEVGHVYYSPALQRSVAATEAMYLLMRRVFDELGYRRYEWKCDALNAPSRAAAERLGFRFEGVFRQAVVYKGRNRDTAWYSVIDAEWPMLKARFERWLDPANFDATGRQRRRLADC